MKKKAIRTDAKFKDRGKSHIFAKIILYTFATVVAVLLFAILLSNISLNDIKTLTIAYLCFVLGKVLELRIITGSWITVLLTSAGALLASLPNFMNYENEAVYSMQRHVNNWPFAFSLMFFIIVICFFRKKVTAKMTEGVTFLQSICFFYYLYELYRANEASGYWVWLALIPLLISLMYILSEQKNSEREKLHLSIMSSAIMAFFAVIYVQNILALGTVEDLLARGDFMHATFNSLEYFLLGASGAYIAQNVAMLIGYLPNEDRFFNKEYFKDVAELNADHIERYQDVKFTKRDVFMVLMISSAWLVSNLNLKIVEPNAAVWLLLIFLPLSMDVASRFK